jgi:CHAD domain-containing protein
MAIPPPSSETLAELATRVFDQLHRMLPSYESGALRGDQEAIHDMRVTARKLRVAMSNFAPCLSVELRRRTMSQLTLLADALGRVRDIDVMLESLTAIEESLPRTRRDMIADLGARLRRRRRYHQRRLGLYLRGEDYANLKRSLSELVQTVGAQIENGQTV